MNVSSVSPERCDTMTFQPAWKSKKGRKWNKSEVRNKGIREEME
jgi:hypothetical protein